MASATVTCPHCGKTSPQHLARCQWCHKDMAKSPESIAHQRKQKETRAVDDDATDLSQTPCAKCGEYLIVGKAFCASCGEPVSGHDEIALLRDQVAKLEKRVKEQSRLITQHADVINDANSDIAAIESLINSSSLYSDSFWTRSFTIWGHSLALQGAILAGFYVLLFTFAGCSAVAGS